MSKPHEKKYRQARTLRLLIDPAHSELVQHVLSPLQLKALEHEFLSFTYTIDGKQIHFDTMEAWELLTMSKAIIRHVRQVYFERELLKLLKSANTRSFLKTPLKDAGLPKRLYNIFWIQECKTLADVASFGLHEFNMNGIGHTNRNFLFNLFKSNGCGHLYLFKNYSPKTTK